MSDSHISSVTQMRRLGYVRITSVDNDPTIQNAAMVSAGCYCIFEDTSLDSQKKRPGLAAVLDNLTPGVTLVVWRLAHLDMNARQLVFLLERFKIQGIHLVSIQDNIDTATLIGSAMLQMISLMANVERRVLRERGATLDLVREMPRGRPLILSEALMEKIQKLKDDNLLSAAQIASQVGVSRATVYRSLSMFRERSRETRNDERAAA